MPIPVLLTLLSVSSQILPSVSSRFDRCSDALMFRYCDKYKKIVYFCKIQSSKHATLTNHERSSRLSMFTKQDTDDRPTPCCCLADRVTPAGAAPARTCGVRAADMEALRLPVLSVVT